METLKYILQAVKLFTLKVVKLCLAAGGIGCAGYLAVVQLPTSQLAQDLLAEWGFEKTQAVSEETEPPINIRVYSAGEMGALVRMRANELGVHPLIVAAIIEQESGWNQFAIGDSGKSRGLMQIQARWHRDLCGLKNDNTLLDADVNVQCGIKVYKHYYKQTTGEHGERLWSALRRYNGHGAAASSYANKVMARLNGLLIESTEVG